MMKLFVLASILCTSVLAHAEPESYVQAGAVAGDDDSMLSLGGTVEAGKRLTDTLWLHGEFAAGHTDRIKSYAGGSDVLFPAWGFDPFMTGDGTFTQLRAGLEERVCRRDEHVCAILGADLGFSRAQWEGYDDASRMTTIDSRTAVAFARAGLDFGGQHWRVRPTAELGVATDRSTSANGSLAVAYRF